MRIGLGRLAGVAALGAGVLAIEIVGGLGAVNGARGWLASGEAAAIGRAARIAAGVIGAEARDLAGEAALGAALGAGRGLAVAYRLTGGAPRDARAIGVQAVPVKGCCTVSVRNATREQRMNALDI
jgi:hypothetical protein